MGFTEDSGLSDPGYGDGYGAEVTGEVVDAVEPSEPILSDEVRLLLAFAYLGPLCLVPLFGSRDPFVSWHARHGLGVSIAFAAIVILLYPLDWLLGHYAAPLWRFYFAFELTVLLAYLVVVALSIARAMAGGKFRLPWLSDLADQD